MFICRFRWQLGIHSSSSSCIGTFFSFLALLAFLVLVFEEEQKRVGPKHAYDADGADDAGDAYM